MQTKLLTCVCNLAFFFQKLYILKVLFEKNANMQSQINNFICMNSFHTNVVVSVVRLSPLLTLKTKENAINQSSR